MALRLTATMLCLSETQFGLIGGTSRYSAMQRYSLLSVSFSWHFTALMIEIHFFVKPFDKIVYQMCSTNVAYQTVEVRIHSRLLCIVYAHFCRPTSTV